MCVARAAALATDQSCCHGIAIHAKINKEIKSTKVHFAATQWSGSRSHLSNTKPNFCSYLDHQPPLLPRSTPTTTKCCSKKCFSSLLLSPHHHPILSINNTWCCRLWVQACGAWCWILWKSTASHQRELSKLMRLVNRENVRSLFFLLQSCYLNWLEVAIHSFLMGVNRPKGNWHIATFQQIILYHLLDK